MVFLSQSRYVVGDRPAAWASEPSGLEPIRTTIFHGYLHPSLPSLGPLFPNSGEEGRGGGRGGGGSFWWPRRCRPLPSAACAPVLRVTIPDEGYLDDLADFDRLFRCAYIPEYTRCQEIGKTPCVLMGQGGQPKCDVLTPGPSVMCEASTTFRWTRRRTLSMVACQDFDDVWCGVPMMALSLPPFQDPLWRSNAYAAGAEFRGRRGQDKTSS